MVPTRCCGVGGLEGCGVGNSDYNDNNLMSDLITKEFKNPPKKKNHRPYGL
jgi:hypothetical protein